MATGEIHNFLYMISNQSLSCDVVHVAICVQDHIF